MDQVYTSQYMRNMLKNLFTADLYVKISPNTFEAKNLSTNSHWETRHPETPFTTERLLIGTYSVAEFTLAQLVKNITKSGFLRKSPRILLQPMAFLEGGLSPIEERAFTELAYGVGAFKVVLHTGAELTDIEAIQLLDSATK